MAEALGKSVSTAYNLLASLCDEGVAVRRPGSVYALDPDFRAAIAAAGDRHDLSALVDDLLARTHKRAYLAVPDAGASASWPSAGCRACPRSTWRLRSASKNAHARSGQGPARSLPTKRSSATCTRACAASPRTPSRAPTRCAPSCAASGIPASPPIARSSTRTAAAWRRPCLTRATGSSARSASR